MITEVIETHSGWGAGQTALILECSRDALFVEKSRNLSEGLKVLHNSSKDIKRFFAIFTCSPGEVAPWNLDGGCGEHSRLIRGLLVEADGNGGASADFRDLRGYTWRGVNRRGKPGIGLRCLGLREKTQTQSLATRQSSTPEGVGNYSQEIPTTSKRPRKNRWKASGIL